MRDGWRRAVFIGIAAPAIAGGLPSLSLTRDRPAAISAAIEKSLGVEAIRVRRAADLSATFWIRPELPAAADKEPGGSPILEERVAINGIGAGTLVGAVSFEVPWRDYRDRIVPAGLYTLRYLRQPAIKEHRGVSPFRDFLLLTPASLDRDLDADPREVVERSASGAGSGHPAVMGLFPATASERPRIQAGGEGAPMLVVRAGSIPMALALGGHGHIGDSP